MTTIKKFNPSKMRRKLKKVGWDDNTIDEYIHKLTRDNKQFIKDILEGEL